LILSAPGGRQVYAFNLGSMNEQRTMEVPTSIRARYVHIATSDPQFSIRAAEMLSEIGSDVSIDPGMEIYQRWSTDQLKKVLPHCTRFFGNLGEWEHLGEQMGWTGDIFNFEGKGVPYYQEAFKFIEEAVITLGNKGAVLINSQNIHHEGPVDTGVVVDATGAGDAFRGGFYAALLNGYSSVEALKFGNAMGALSIKGEGPQNYEADWEILLQLLKMN
jgi:sugar/nucleoside kinase (ribokinase family)